MDVRTWTAEMEAEAKSLQEDLGILTNYTMHRAKVLEYPRSAKKNRKRHKPKKSM